MPGHAGQYYQRVLPAAQVGMFCSVSYPDTLGMFGGTICFYRGAQALQKGSTGAVLDFLNWSFSQSREVGAGRYHGELLFPGRAVSNTRRANFLCLTFSTDFCCKAPFPFSAPCSGLHSQLRWVNNPGHGFKLLTYRSNANMEGSVALV